MTETTDTDATDRPWRVRLVCCGRDDREVRCSTRAAAELFRTHYIAADGHARVAIIAGPPDQDERAPFDLLLEYLEAMRGEMGLGGFAEDTIALAHRVAEAHLAEVAQLRARVAELEPVLTHVDDRVVYAAGKVGHAAAEKAVRTLAVAEVCSWMTDLGLTHGDASDWTVAKQIAAAAPTADAFAVFPSLVTGHGDPGGI